MKKIVKRVSLPLLALAVAALLFAPARVLLAQAGPIAYRLGYGAQMTCTSSPPTSAPTRGTVWCKSTDSNKLYYTTPAGSSSALGTSTATLATTYSATSSNNRITSTSTGGPVLIEPSLSSQGTLLQSKTSGGTTLFSSADNAAATLYGNAADSGTNAGTRIGAATALSSSRPYVTIDNGSGTAQWKAYTTAGSVRVLECTAGSSAQVAGPGGLNLAGSITSDANIGISDAAPMSFVSGQTASNGAAYLLNTANTLGGSDLIIDAQNNNTDVFAVDGSGAITTPSVGIAALSATGTPSSTTYLRGDNTWASVAGGATGNYSFSSNAVDLSGAAEMSIAPTTATGVTVGQRLKAPELVTTSSAPTLSGGASGYFGTLASTSVTGTNAAGVIAFTTGTLGSAPAGQAAATAEVLKITFSGGFTAPNGCVVDWLKMGADNDVAAQNWAGSLDNYNYDVTTWGVCSTTTCSLYMNTGAAVSYAGSSAYKLGYKVDCY